MPYKQEPTVGTSHRAKWNEYCKLYFPDYSVLESAPTSARLMSNRNPEDQVILNDAVISALSGQYNRGFDDGYADAREEYDNRDFSNMDEGDASVYRDQHVHEGPECVRGTLADEIPFAD